MKTMKIHRNANGFEQKGNEDEEDGTK